MGSSTSTPTIRPGHGNDVTGLMCAGQVSIKINFGGETLHKPKAKYRGGKSRFSGYVQKETVCLEDIRAMCRKIGFRGLVRIYRIDSFGKWKEMRFVADVKLLVGCPQKVVEVYVEGEFDGSSCEALEGARVSDVPSIGAKAVEGKATVVDLQKSGHVASGKGASCEVDRPTNLAATCGSGRDKAEVGESERSDNVSHSHSGLGTVDGDKRANGDNLDSSGDGRSGDPVMCEVRASGAGLAAGGVHGYERDNMPKVVVLGKEIDISRSKAAEGASKGGQLGAVGGDSVCKRNEGEGAGKKTPGVTRLNAKALECHGAANISNGCETIKDAVRKSRRLCGESERKSGVCASDMDRNVLGSRKPVGVKNNGESEKKAFEGDSCGVEMGKVGFEGPYGGEANVNMVKPSETVFFCNVGVAGLVEIQGCESNRGVAECRGGKGTDHNVQRMVEEHGCLASNLGSYEGGGDASDFNLELEMDSIMADLKHEAAAVNNILRDTDSVDDGLDSDDELSDSDYVQPEETSEGSSGSGGDGFEEDNGTNLETTNSGDVYDEEGVSSGNDFASDIRSDVEAAGDRFPVFNPATKYSPKFKIGMLFSNKAEFRDAINGYVVQARRCIRILKNDSRRVYAVCSDSTCKWRINALKFAGESSFQIRVFVSKHTCAAVWKVRNASARWLAKKYEDTFRQDPRRRVKGFRNDVVKEIKCNISQQQAYRAKRLSLASIEGDAASQYAKLWDYTNAMVESNPGTTALLRMEESSCDGGGRRFSKLYVCWKALSSGFMGGCRPIVGVDGCHLKGPHKGVLLSAVGIDPNNDMFPIAYCVVASETRESWEWFLMLLKEDLNILRDDMFTFISDKQKGLVPAFEKVFPGSSNRFCVRHLHGNMKVAGFKGQAFKSFMWMAATATTEREFETVMQELGQMDPKCMEWLAEKHPSQWSRSHFSGFCKCDILLNNLCESFNSCILEAREKPIIPMLEWIRQWLMARLQERRDRAKNKWSDRLLCPRINKILQKQVDKMGECMPLKADDRFYEIHCSGGGQYRVDLGGRTCSCRKWELTGIPCMHAVSAICSESLDPTDYVHEYYRVETFIKVYSTTMLPMPGEQQWKKTGLEPPIPPKVSRGVGRPTRARRREPDEVMSKGRKRARVASKKKDKDVTDLGRQNFKVTCSFCREKGHNKKGCLWRKFNVDARGNDPPEEMTQQDDCPPATQNGEPTEQAAEGNEMAAVIAQGECKDKVDAGQESSNSAAAATEDPRKKRKRGRSSDGTPTASRARNAGDVDMSTTHANIGGFTFPIQVNRGRNYVRVYQLHAAARTRGRGKTS